MVDDKSEENTKKNKVVLSLRKHLAEFAPTKIQTIK